MEILNPNRIKLRLDENIFELINLIKPSHQGEFCSFLEGPIWCESKTFYKEKLANRTYWVINHHLYRVTTAKGPESTSVFLRVSGRGNINSITREEALEVVKTRVGYVEDSVLMELEPDDDPAIPYTENQDW